MDINFEYLKESDLEETYDLCMRSFGEDFPFEEVRRVYEKCRNDPHYHFIVGKLGGKVAAYTTMVIFYDLFDGDNPIAMLWYVCVDEKYRRQGIAGKMFQKLEQIAADNNCELICLNCRSENAGAQKFYRSMGYSDTKEKAFVKYLDDERTP